MNLIGTTRMQNSHWSGWKVGGKVSHRTTAIKPGQRASAMHFCNAPFHVPIEIGENAIDRAEQVV